MPNAWMRFQSQCRHAYGDDAWDVPIDGALPTDDVGLLARLEVQSPIYFFTKDAFLTKLRQFTDFREINLVRRYGLPSRLWLSAFGRMAHGREVVRFVGDLDPCDLGAFRALETGSPDLVPVRRWPLILSYGGVDSNWIALWERVLGGRIERYSIRMDSLERQQYRALRDTWPELSSVIGARAFRLLESGRKVEVEAFAQLINDKKPRQEFVDLVLGGSAGDREAVRAIVLGIGNKALQASRTLNPNPFHRAFLTRHIQQPYCHPDSQLAALVALMKVPGPADLAILADIVMNRDIPTLSRAQTAEALGRRMRLGGRRSAAWQAAARTLIRALSDPAPEVRLFAAHALGNAGVESALPALGRLARDDKTRTAEFGSVGHAAHNALEQLQSPQPAVHVMRLPFC